MDYEHVMDTLADLMDMSRHTYDDEDILMNVCEVVSNYEDLRNS